MTTHSQWLRWHPSSTRQGWLVRGLAVGGSIQLGPPSKPWSVRQAALCLHGHRIELGAIFFKDEARAKAEASKRAREFCRAVRRLEETL